MTRLRIAYQRFTSCSGCQLTLLNCERQLPQLAGVLELVNFSMASSARDETGPLDLVLIEGSISTAEQLQQLLALRDRKSVV